MKKQDQKGSKKEKRNEKKKVAMMLALVMTLTMVGCGSKEIMKETTLAVVGESEEETQETTVAVVDESQMKVFYGDQNAEFILTKSVLVKAITDEEVMKQLTEAGVFTGKEVLNSAKEETIDGEKCLVLDFNAAFAEEVASKGTAGENILIGSMVNTFLTAHPNCAKIKLTAEGNTVESGHAIYDELLGFYGPQEITISATVKVEGEEQDVEMTRSYCEMGFSLNYDAERFAFKNEDKKRASICMKDDRDAAALFIELGNQNKADTLENLKSGLAETPEVTEVKLGADGLAATKLFGISAESNHRVIYYVLEQDDQIWILHLDYTMEMEEGMLPLLQATVDSFAFVK